MKPQPSVTSSLSGINALDGVPNRDPQLAEVLETYLAELDAGQRPNRNAFFAKYPELADQLADCLDALDLVHHLAPQLGPSTQSDQSNSTQAILPDAVALGDFRIIRELGRGGMGIVYEAEQLSLRRRMALKVLPFAGVLDEQLLKRFKNESLAAATLDHPNIVQVHSVGCDRGVHYYAMQLIEGQSLAETITELRRDLSRRDEDQQTSIAGSSATSPPASPTVETRRELQAWVSTVQSLGTRGYFRSVANLGLQAAEALNHAHANGILHRDIKPGNLLIDGKGKLWVTDFGLARIEAHAPMTMTGDLLGTLRYMCPESAAGGGEKLVVDHRADIYSLGITLYELLTLQPAFEGKDRKEIIQKIIFAEPRPPRQISKAIPSNLETIVLKAIRKEPSDRYTTAGELAADLKRFLNDEPICARRPTFAERTRMWSRRNRTIVAAAVVLLVFAAAGSLIMSGLIWNEQVRTADALKESRENQRKAEEKNAESDAIISFLIDDLLLTAGLSRTREDPFTVADVLANAEKKIEAAFQAYPSIEARIRYTLAQTYEKLGNYEAAEQHLRRAQVLDEQRYGTTHANHLEKLSKLCQVLTFKGKLNEAYAIAEQVVEIRRQAADSDPLLMIRAWDDLASVRGSQGHHQDAEKLYRNILELCRREFGADDPKTLQSMGLVARALEAQRRLVEARQLREEILGVRRRVFGPEDQETIAEMANLSLVLSEEGEHDQACAVLDQAIEILNRVHGADDRSTLNVKRVKIRCLINQKKIAEADVLTQEILAARTRTMGAEHPATLRARQDSALLFHEKGMYEAGMKELEQVLEIQNRVLGLEHPDTLVSMTNLAANYGELGRYDEARAVYERALEIQRRIKGFEHPSTLSTIQNIARTVSHKANYNAGDPLTATAQNEEALAIREKVLEAQERVLGSEHPDTLQSRVDVAQSLSALGRVHEARQHYEQVLDVQERVFGLENPTTAKTLLKLAVLERRIGQNAKASELFKQCYGIFCRTLGAEHPTTLGPMYQLARIYEAQRDFEQSHALLEELVEIRTRVLGQEHPETLLSIAWLELTAHELGHYEQAHALCRVMADACPRVFGAKHPIAVQADCELAHLGLVQGRYDDALKFARKVVDRDIELFGPDYLYLANDKALVAESLDGLKRFDEAHRIWEEIEPAARGNFKSENANLAWILRGFALHLACAPDTSAADLARALQMATEATELDPAYSECWRSLGVVYAASDQWQQSKEAFIQTIELGCPRELLPSALLERIDNGPNQSDGDFRQLMELIHDHTQRLTASRSQTKDE